MRFNPARPVRLAGTGWVSFWKGFHYLDFPGRARDSGGGVDRGLASVGHCKVGWGGRVQPPGFKGFNKGVFAGLPQIGLNPPVCFGCCCAIKSSRKIRLGTARVSDGGRSWSAATERLSRQLEYPDGLP